MDGAVDKFDNNGWGKFVGADAGVESVAYSNSGKGANANSAVAGDAGGPTLVVYLRDCTALINNGLLDGCIMKHFQRLYNAITFSLLLTCGALADADIGVARALEPAKLIDDA